MKNRFREFIQAFFFRLSPFLIVAALECLLIIFGVGQSYRLFREKSQNDILAMNKSYHGRFYSIEKYEQPNYLTPVFSREKPANTRRLFFVCDQTLFNLFEHAESQPLLRDFRDKNGVNYEIVQISVPLTNSFFAMQVLKHLQNQDSDGIVVMT